MIKKFYVDIDQLYAYSNFLKKCMAEVNKQLTQISKANNTYQTLMRDDISKQVEIQIKKLKKVFDNFSVEIDKMSKNVKEDHQKWLQYNSKMKL